MAESSLPNSEPIAIYLIRKRQARIAMTGLTLLEIENCNREADSHALD